MSQSLDKPWPTELRLNREKTLLTVAFQDAKPHELSAEYLRVCSPSAEVQGHSPEQRKTIPGKRNVKIVDIQPVGNYAVKIIFDDTHDSGIFSWDYLYKLIHERDIRWNGYLRELEEKGLSRG